MGWVSVCLLELYIYHCRWGGCVSRNRISPFSKYALALAGIYELTYDLYLELTEIYENTYADYITTSTRNSPVLYAHQLDRLSRKAARDAIDKYLSASTFFYTDEWERIYSNATGMNGFSMLNIKKSQPLSIEIKNITFTQFIEELEWLIVSILLRRKQYTLPKTPREIVEKKLFKHIASVVERCENNRFLDVSEKLRSNNSPLIIYKSLSSISCNREKHTVISSHCYNQLIDKSRWIKLPIHHCLNCGKRFMGWETLRVYEDLYGMFFFERKTEKGNAPDKNGFASLEAESKLHSMGYNVIAGEMTERERRSLLEYLLDEGKITYLEADRDISQAISRLEHSPSHADAVRKWRSDLFFLGEREKQDKNCPTNISD